MEKNKSNTNVLFFILFFFLNNSNKQTTQKNLSSSPNKLTILLQNQIKTIKLVYTFFFHNNISTNKIKETHKRKWKSKEDKEATETEDDYSLGSYSWKGDGSPELVEVVAGW